MKDSIKMIAAIVIFATVACVGLAFVYEGTKETISKQAEENLNAALKDLFPEADGFQKVSPALTSGNPAAKISDSYLAKKGGGTAGIAVTAASFGFNADITAIVGVDTAGKITGVKILSNTDTPGLGANASNDKYFVNKQTKTTFYGQFTGMSKDSKISVQKDGGDVIAITAATISSRAVSLLVNEAVKAGYKYLTANAGGADTSGAADEGTIPTPNSNGGSN